MAEAATFSQWSLSKNRSWHAAWAQALASPNSLRAAVAAKLCSCCSRNRRSRRNIHQPPILRICKRRFCTRTGSIVTNLINACSHILEIMCRYFKAQVEKIHKEIYLKLLFKDDTMPMPPSLTQGCIKGAKEYSDSATATMWCHCLLHYLYSSGSWQQID